MLKSLFCVLGLGMVMGIEGVATCYRRDNLLPEDSTYTPCNTQTPFSMCVRSQVSSDGSPADTLCFPNGVSQNIFQGGFQYWRHGCTDPTWESPYCQTAFDSCDVDSSGNAQLTPCGAVDGGTTTWCCGANVTDCCGTENAISIAAVLGPVVLPTTSTTSITSISSTSTSTASPTTVSTTKDSTTVSTSTTSTSTSSSTDTATTTTKPSSTTTTSTPSTSPNSSSTTNLPAAATTSKSATTTSSSSLDTSKSTTSKSSTLSTGAKAGIAIVAVAIGVAALLAIFYFFRRSKRVRGVPLMQLEKNMYDGGGDMGFEGSRSLGSDRGGSEVGYGGSGFEGSRSLGSDRGLNGVGNVGYGDVGYDRSGSLGSDRVGGVGYGAERYDKQMGHQVYEAHSEPRGTVNGRVEAQGGWRRPVELL